MSDITQLYIDDVNYVIRQHERDSYEKMQWAVTVEEAGGEVFTMLVWASPEAMRAVEDDDTLGVRDVRLAQDDNVNVVTTAEREEYTGQHRGTGHGRARQGEGTRRTATVHDLAAQRTRPPRDGEPLLPFGYEGTGQPTHLPRHRRRK